MSWDSCPHCKKPVHYYDGCKTVLDGVSVRIRSYGPCNCGWSGQTEERLVKENPETLRVRSKFGMKGAPPPVPKKEF